MVIVRQETSIDYAAIQKINIDAFAKHPHSQQTEHLIVNALRDAKALTLSLVAEEAGEILGHIAFSPVLIDGQDLQWLALGPVAVTPDHQRRGIGAQLITSGLHAIRQSGANGCAVVGEPVYYTRFGFRHSPSLRIHDIPAEYFLCLPLNELEPHGIVTHHPAFFVTA